MPAPSVGQLPLSVPVFHILLALVDQDLHGYAILNDIARRTEGEVTLTASTLYGAIARLLDEGFIAEVDSEVDRRRSYRLTRAGRELLRLESERLARTANWARQKRVLRPRTS
jgi:DNA-binding PadR family transcriptional regulator